VTTLPRANAQRVLLGSVGAVARGTLRDQDGVAANAAGSVTASLFDAAGVLSGAANRAAASSGAGAYTLALTTAECATLNVWRVDWFDAGVFRASSYARIVGGFMFSTDELAEMAGVAAFTTPVRLQAREWATNMIEHQTGAAWNPRYDVDAWYRTNLSMTHVLTCRPVIALRYATVNAGSVVDISNTRLDRVAGVVHDVGWYGQCEIGYTHGYDQPPETLRRAALLAAADVLLRGASGLSERTRSATNDLGVVQQFSFPGLDHPTGLDFVDSAIRAHDHRIGEVG